MAVTFPTTLDSFADRSSGDTISEDHMNDVQDAIELLEAKVGINTSLVDTSLDFKVNNFFVENTRRIWFYEASGSPATGWTLYSTVSDCVLGVVGGSAAYSVTSGNGTEYGTWAVAGLTNAGEAAHVHAAGAHTHTMGNESAAGASGATWAVAPNLWGVVTGGQVKMYQGNVGGSARDVLSDVVPAGSGNTAGGSSHTHTSSSDSSWRPYAAVGFIATFTGA